METNTSPFKVKWILNMKSGYTAVVERLNMKSGYTSLDSDNVTNTTLEVGEPLNDAEVILGSSSVARQKILVEMGYEFTIMSADIDEKGIRKNNPEELVMALAEAKADAIMSKLQSLDKHDKDIKPTLLIASDTVVVYEGMVREKPSNKEEARQFIKGYSGGHAATVSSVIVTNLNTGLRKGDWDRVEIYFHNIPDEVIDNLIEEGKVLNVAGGLIIEHPLIVPYVKQVVGTTDSVMGLPKALTEKLMKDTF